MREVRERFHPIYQDYREDYSKVQDLYHYHPLSFQEKREELLSSYKFHRQVLVKALTAYNTKMGARRETLSAIQRLASPSTMAIVTGQQAGLLTGPLYTIYKAISLLQMKERLEEEGIVVAPIFWMATEDHDYEEINHIYFLNKSNRLTALSLEKESSRAPIGHRALSKAEAEDLLSCLSQETPQTEFKEEIMDLLHKTLQPSHTLGEWFGRLLLALFSKRGLILLDPLIEDLREEKASFFQDLYTKRHLLEDALKKREEEMQKKGYPLQVKREEGRLPFFISCQGEREALFESTEGFKTRQGELLFSFSQLEALVKEEPEKLTSTALTRPILQSYLLPTLLYIAGPSELAYYGQLKEAFLLFGQKTPLLCPRSGMTIIEGRVLEHMEEHHLQLADVLTHLQGEMDKRQKEGAPVNIDGLFGTIKEHWQKEYGELIEELGRAHPEIKALGEKNLKRILKEVEYLEGKAWQFHKRRDKTLKGHFQRMKEALNPKGDLQERRLNLFPFLIKHGFSLLHEIEKTLSLNKEHTILYYRGVNHG